MTTIDQLKLVELEVEKPKTATHAIRISQTMMLATMIANVVRQTTTTAANDQVADEAEAADDLAQAAITTAEIRKTKATQAGQTVVVEGDAGEAETIRRAIILKATKTAATLETKTVTTVVATENDTAIQLNSMMSNW